MESKYMKMAKIFKALSDPKRVKIVDMLSCGEMCACVLLKCFEITQPTIPFTSTFDTVLIGHSVNTDFEYGK